MMTMTLSNIATVQVQDHSGGCEQNDGYDHHDDSW